MVSLARWMLPLGALLTLVGYFGPWIPHQAAGLVLSGLDLGELVKFLHSAEPLRLVLGREGFYLPLVAASVGCSCGAFRASLRYPAPLRVSMLVVGSVSAINLLPPAWTPSLLATPEFRLQTTVMIVCLTLAVLSPLLSLLPSQLISMCCLLCSFGALWITTHNFFQILPTLRQLYASTLAPGWGLWVTSLGLLVFSGAVLLLPLAERVHNTGYRQSSSGEEVHLASPL